jgi:hypothetical protein
MAAANAVYSTSKIPTTDTTKVAVGLNQTGHVLFVAQDSEAIPFEPHRILIVAKSGAPAPGTKYTEHASDIPFLRPTA